MVEYVKQLLQEILDKSGNYVFTLIDATVEELDRIDPRDLLPDAQFNFVVNKALLKKYVGSSFDPHNTMSLKEKIDSICNKLLETLDNYTGEGSHGKRRAFNYVSDSDLKKIIERDYFELKVHLFPSGAWKSVVILAGSILEAILFDALCKDTATITKAEASSKAPKEKLGTGKWKLVALIEVSTELGILPSDRADTIDQVLRDFRNFVHPQKEIRSKYECTEAEAYLAIGALDGVCNFFENRTKTP